MNPPVVPTKPDIVMPPSTLEPVTSATHSSPINTSIPPVPPKNRKALFAIVGIILLTITTLSGFILIARPVLFKSNAWNCGAYTFALSSSGNITVTNGSSASEPLQRADVFVNNQLIKTVDVPALAVGESKTIGSITVPNTSFSWQINGTSDCSNAGRIDVTVTSYQCQNIKAYPEDSLTPYTPSELAALAVGSKIRLVAAGTGPATNYSAVRFTVNGTVLPESALKNTNGEYYTLYTIPSGTKTFAITAQLKGVDNNWY